MCVVSMIGDEWAKRREHSLPPWIKDPDFAFIPNEDRRLGQLKEEIADLRKEMQELKKLLVAAKVYDATTGQPDCEVDEKVDLIKRVADLVGVDMAEVFGTVQ